MASLNAELAGLKVQADRLHLQLALDKGPAYSSIQVRATEVALQIGKVEGNIAQLQARLAARQGTSSTAGTPPPVGARDRGVDPRMVPGMLFVLALAVVIPMAIALARRFSRGGARPGPSDVATITPRLDRLELAVDSIAIEVERISEGQRFVTKILAEQQQVQPPIGTASSISRDSPG